MSRFLFTAFILVLTTRAFAEAPKKVQIDFVETLAPRDTTSSERFQKEYEGAIDLSKSLLKPKLTKCGYELETKTTFYEASDALKAKEIGQKISKTNSWLIVGPRRSNHYLLLVQGAGQTSTISLMAGADDVSKLGPSHTSISPTNSQLALIAAKEARAQNKKSATYMSIVSDDCTACVDFSKAFDIAAKNIGLKKLGDSPITGENFDVEPMKAAFMKLKPSFILLPNYSKVSVRIMNAFNSVPNPPLFIGSDGWGDQRYGFIQSGAGIENIRGMAVRGFPPVEQGLQAFPLGKQALNAKKDLPFSGAGLGLIKIVDEIANTLCAERPKDQQQFTKALQKNKRLNAPWGVSVYQLKSSEITFLKKVAIK